MTVKPDRLAVYGCDAAQGWYLSKAMPPDVATGWLEEFRHREAVVAGAPLQTTLEDAADAVASSAKARLA